VEQSSASQALASPPPEVGTEDLSKATEYSSTYHGGRGTTWERWSLVPVNYQDSSHAWHAIDTALHPDPGVPGGFVSGANWWHVHFAPLVDASGGVAVDAPDGSVSFVPRGAGAVSPEVGPSGPSTVVYKGAWPGADLDYTVTPTGVDEDIVVHDASAPTTYTFSTPGKSLGAPGAGIAGAGAGLPRGWSFREPRVLGRHGRSYSSAGQALEAVAGGARVSVSRLWLAGLPPSAFPVDIDPSVQSAPMPPWDWAPKNSYPNDVAVFCEASGGYTGHPSSGPLSTCTAPDGDAGVVVGYGEQHITSPKGAEQVAEQTLQDWQTELAFDVPVDNPDPDVPAGTLWDPSGCNASAVGSTSQSPYCAVVTWAQVGLGNNDGAQYIDNGALNVFRGKADWAYSSAAPYVLATGPTQTDTDDNVTARGHAWTVSTGPGTTPDSRFPCNASDTAEALTLGDLWQQWLCNGPGPVPTNGASQTYGAYLTLGVSAGTGGLGSASSTALGCSSATGCGAPRGCESPSGAGDNCGPFETFDKMDLWVDYTYEPLAPSPVADPVTTSATGRDDVTLSVAPGEARDPDGEALSYDFLMVGSDGSSVQSGWEPSSEWSGDPAWDFPVSPGVTYTWTTLVEDPYASVSADWAESFSSPGTAPQTAPMLIAPPSGAVGVQDIGGYNPSGSPAACPCKLNSPSSVLPVTGAIDETSEDLSVPGAGMALGLTRTYDSWLAQLQSAPGGPAPGPLGYGWSYNLGMSLSEDASTGEVTVDQENGSEVSFAPDSTSACPTNYCPADPGTLATLEHNSDGSWTMVRDTGGETTFNFSSAGALVSESDTQGGTLTSATESPGSGACPSSAGSCTVWTDNQSGRSLTLVFDSSGSLASATTAATAAGTDSAGTVAYCYFGQSCAGGSGAGGSRDLYSAALPSGTTTYGYDTRNANASFVNDITTEQTPDGAVSNSYSSTGQVTYQSAPSGTVSLAYAGNNQQPGSNGVPGGTVVVTSTPAGAPAPEQAEYEYSSGALVAEVTGYGTSQAATQYFDLDQAVLVPEAVQSPAPSGTSSVELAQNYFGGAGLQAADVTKSVDAMGNTTVYAYNAYNQAWCEVAPAEYLAGVNCPASPPPSPPPPGAAAPSWAGATINFYNSSDQLTATTGPLGRTTTYAYTSGVAGVPDGLQYCSVGPAAYAAGVTCPAYGAAHVTGTTTSTFDPAGDVLTSTGADGATTAYQYTDPDHLGMATVTTAPDGEVTTVAYDTAGQVVSSTESSGSYTATTKYAYDAQGQLYCTAPAAEVAAGVGCPTSPPSASAPPAGVTSDFYDAEGHLVQSTGPTGATTLYAYDSTGHQYCTVGPQAYSQGVTCPSSPPTSAPAAGSDPYPGATITTYNAEGQVAQVTNPLGGTTVSTYDADGNLGSQTVGTGSSGAPAVTTEYAYDADNRLLTETVGYGSPLAATTAYAYDPDGNVYCSASAKAYASAYSCPQWLPGYANAVPSVATLYAPSSGSPLAVGVTTSFYNADGELVQSSGPDKATTVSVYGPGGQVVCAQDAADMAATLAASPSEAWPYACPASPVTTPPVSGSGPGYEASIYDLGGRLASSTDATGATTSYTYGADGSVLTTTGPGGQVTTDCYYWEASGCAANAPAGGGDAGDLYSTTSPPAAGEPKGATTKYTYLPGGATATTTTAAGTATSTYDAAGDLLSTAYSSPAAGYEAAPRVGYTYNAAGLVHTMTDGTGTTTYTYDDDGDLLASAFSAASASGLGSGTTSYTYYPDGQRASLTYPVAPSGGSPTVGYSYNASGQLQSLTDWAGRTIGFGYDPDGNTTTTTYPDSTYVSASYDLGDAETSFSASAGTPSSPGAALMGASYSLDSAEQVSAEVGTGAIARSVSYTYSPADRLGTVAVGSATPTAEAYDASGDPTALANGTTGAFDADGQLTSATEPGGSTVTYGYNATGDRTSASTGGSVGTTTTTTAPPSTTAPATTTTAPAATTAGPTTTTTAPTTATTTGVPGGSTATYSYDEADRLVGATGSAGVTASYAYNGDGLLTGRTTPAGTATDFWDGSSTPLLLSDGANDYLYGPDGTPVEQAGISAGTPEYYVSDDRGSTRALLGQGGSVDATFSFDPYGNVAASTGTATTPLLYDGQYRDTTTGLYYLRARWYDPGTDQFTSVDPDVAETGEPYAYVGDDPVNDADPDGEDAASADAAWLGLIAESGVGYVSVVPSLATEYLEANDDGSPADIKSYVNSFDWTRPVVMVAGYPQDEYLKYGKWSNYGGARLFGTNQVYTTRQAAVDDLYLRPYGNSARFVWLVQVTAEIPLLWGYVAHSGSGKGQQFVVGPWESDTKFIARTVTRNAGKFTRPPYNVRQVATVPGEPLGYKSQEVPEGATSLQACDPS
jgi:RHS repeat-associated protein